MKVKKETYLDEQLNKAPISKSHKIDLTNITNLINELNIIMAPTINKDIQKVISKYSDEKVSFKNRVVDIKKLSDEYLSLVSKKDKLLKQLQVITLLNDLHTNYVPSEKIKKDTIQILDDLDKYTIKKLTFQIDKLKKVLNQL